MSLSAELEAVANDPRAPRIVRESAEAVARAVKAGRRPVMDHVSLIIHHYHKRERQQNRYGR